LRNVLTDRQHSVDVAEAALDALVKLRAHSYDLAIVDLFLPGIDGLQLAEAIHVLDPATPVILMTAYGTPSFEAMAAHPAINHYLHKPFSIDHLLALVDRCLLPAGPT